MKRIKIVEIWFVFVIIILLILLYDTIFNIKVFSISFWARLLFLVIAFTLSVLIANDYLMKGKISRRKIRTMQEQYAYLVKRKDDEIDELKKQQELILKSSVKRTTKQREIEEELNKLKAENRELKRKIKKK